MGHRLGKRVLPLLLVAACATALAAGAEEEPAGAFVSMRVARSGDIPAEQRAQAVAELARQQADPQHVVVLVHGWDTPYYQSTRQFGRVAPQVRAEFDRLNERAAVLGIQWDSNVGPRRTWIPAAFGHYFFSLLGLRKVIRDPYTSRIPVARTLGRTGLRQILFDVRDRFPEARIHVFAHSMGAEATAHAINPEFTPLSAGDDTPVYRPERPLKLDVVALAGADLDFDSGARS
ncbi:MAG TPA: alpha/beta hydrolase, partial [Armatimonadota bacterium]|nr:alpha/beta hydrolase [Armatimonadota bacterium]